MLLTNFSPVIAGIELFLSNNVTLLLLLTPVVFVKQQMVLAMNAVLSFVRFNERVWEHILQLLCRSWFQQSIVIPLPSHMSAARC